MLSFHGIQAVWSFCELGEGNVDVSVITHAGLHSNSKPFFVGIPNSVLKANVNFELTYNLNMIYCDSLLMRIDSALVGGSIGGTATWGANGFTYSWSNSSNYTSGSVAVTFPTIAARIATVDFTYTRQYPWTDHAHRESYQYTGANIIEWRSGSGGGSFFADTPLEMAAVTTSLAGCVISRNSAFLIGGNPIVGFSPRNSSITLTLLHITY